MAHSISCTHVNTFDELHDEGVNALVALPDNQHALSGSNDGTVKLFNVNDGAVLRTFKHFDFFWTCVTSLALLPDGLRFVSGSNDRAACIAYHGLAPVQYRGERRAASECARRIKETRILS